MTFARRLSAATMALLLALFPVAMERCRTACVTTGSHTAPSAHVCHEASSDDSAVRMDPMARACGHNDDARTLESTRLAAAKTRTVLLLPLVAALPRHVDVALASLSIDWSLDRSRLPRPLVPLNSPLRL